MGVLTSPQSVARSRLIQRLQKVADVGRRQTAVEVELRESVAAARREGASWTDIGKALGITRQSSWKRFS